MEERASETSEYYIVFGKANYNHWLFRFLDKEFQHVYAVKKSPGEQFWIIINPKRGFTSVTMESVAEFPHIRALCPGKVILKVQATATYRCRQWFWHINCVEIVKTLLGLKNRRIIWRILIVYNLRSP